MEKVRESHVLARKPAPRGTTISKDQGRTLTFLLFTKRFIDYYFDSTVGYSITIKLIKKEKKKNFVSQFREYSK